MDKIENIYNLLNELSQKSDELMIGDFKQYVDEEWIDKMYELIGELEK